MADDNVDNPQALSAAIVTSGWNYITSSTGLFTVYYNVDDAAGNIADTKSRIVQVVSEGDACESSGITDPSEGEQMCK